MARKESSGKQPIFDESEPVRAGVGRTARTVNKLVRDWLLESQERPLRFLTAGQQGSESVLISNLGLLGSNVSTDFANASEQEGEKVDGSTAPVVTVHKWKKHGVIDVTMFDTPGLHSDTVDETDAVAQLVRKVGSHINLLVFCSKLAPSSRVTKVEERTVTRLTRAFGETLWQKAVLLFSFADFQEMAKIDHQKLIAVHEAGLHDCIRKAGVPQSVIRELPLCIAGNADQLSLEVLRKADPKVAPSLLMLKWGPEAAIKAMLLSVGGSVPSTSARSNVTLSKELKAVIRDKFQAWKEARTPVLEQKPKQRPKSSECIVC